MRQRVLYKNRFLSICNIKLRSGDSPRLMLLPLILTVLNPMPPPGFYKNRISKDLPCVCTFALSFAPAVLDTCCCRVVQIVNIYDTSPSNSLAYLSETRRSGVTHSKTTRAWVLMWFRGPLGPRTVIISGRQHFECVP